MKIIPGRAQLAKDEIASSIVTIGNYDGVHLGHRSLIERVVSTARKKGKTSVVFTFNPHPVQVLYPEKKLSKLFDLADQEEQLAALGVDYLVVEPFSKKFSEVHAEDFLREWIVKPLKPEMIIVGYDFTFGAGRSGTIDFLREQCSKLQVSVEVMPPVKVNGMMVSSSKIRQALAAGDVALAAALLGRNFYVEGEVVEGFKRGRQIGIHTANLKMESESWPSVGVYACWVQWNKQKYSAVTNIGISPTFQDLSPQVRIETHLLDFSDDLYGQRLRVEFVQRLRDEKKFSSVDELKNQIHTDIVSARTILGSHRG